MLILNFSINNIRNPLQRYYRRGQTVLPFEQNKCVRRQMKSKGKFFVKIIKLIIKNNMGQTVLSFDQKTCFDQKTKLILCFLTKILLKEKSAEPDQIKLALL